MIDVSGGKRSGSNDRFNEIVRVTTEALTNWRNVVKGSVNTMGEGRDGRPFIFRSAGDGPESGKPLGKNNKSKRVRKEKKIKSTGIKKPTCKKTQHILIDSTRRRGNNKTGSVNNNQRGQACGKYCEEVLLNDKQPAEINGSNVTCEEWRRG